LVAVLTEAETGGEAGASTGGQRTPPLVVSCRPAQQRAFEWEAAAWFFCNSVCNNSIACAEYQKPVFLVACRGFLYPSRRNLPSEKGYCASSLSLISSRLLANCSIREKARDSRRSRESRAPICDLSTADVGLPSGRRTEFLCGPGDHTYKSSRACLISAANLSLDSVSRFCLISDANFLSYVNKFCLQNGSRMGP